MCYFEGKKKAQNGEEVTTLLQTEQQQHRAHELESIPL